MKIKIEVSAPVWDKRHTIDIEEDLSLDKEQWDAMDEQEKYNRIQEYFVDGLEPQPWELSTFDEVD